MTVQEKIIRMPRLSEFAKEKKQGLRIVVLQLLVALITTVSAYIYSVSWVVASACLWGATTAVMSGYFLMRSLSKIEKIQIYQPHSLLREMYRNSMERYLVVIISLAIAMGALRLPAAAVLCGFVVAQVVPIVARILMIKR